MARIELLNNFEDVKKTPKNKNSVSSNLAQIEVWTGLDNFESTVLITVTVLNWKIDYNTRLLGTHLWNL